VSRLSQARSPSFNGLKLAPCLALFWASLYNDFFSSWWIRQTGNPVVGSEAPYIKTTKAEFFIVKPELLDTVSKASHEGGIPADRIFVFNVRRQSVLQGFGSWVGSSSQSEEDWIRFNDIGTCKKTESARLTTFATTDPPKTALQSHYNASPWRMTCYEIGTPP
jgi:hypothetical protein